MEKKIIYLEILGALCYFVPLIIINVFLLNVKGFSLLELSSITLVLVLSARISRIFIAPLIHMFKVNLNLSIMSFIGSIGYLIITVSHNYYFTILGALCIGLFYSNIALLTKILAVFRSKNTMASFSLLHSYTNLTIVIGTIIINILYLVNTHLPFVIISALLLFSSIINLQLFKSIDEIDHKNHLKKIINIISNYKILITFLFIIFGWFIMSYIMTMSPILFSKSGYVKYIWGIAFINASINFFSFYLNKSLHKVLIKYRVILCIILLILSLILLNVNLFLLVFTIVLVSLIEMLFIPLYQHLLVSSIDKKEVVALLSISIIPVAIGDSLGTYFAIYFSQFYI